MKQNMKTSDSASGNAQITLEVTGQSPEILSLREQFSDIVNLHFAIGDKTPIHEEGSTYNYVQLLIGTGTYPAALRDAESWLVTHAPQVTHIRSLEANAGMRISTPVIMKDKVDSCGQIIRVPFSLVQLCSEGQLDISFSMNVTRDAK